MAQARSLARLSRTRQTQGVTALRHWTVTARRLWYLHLSLYSVGIVCWFLAWLGPHNGADRRAFGFTAGISTTIAFVIGLVAYFNRA